MQCQNFYWLKISGKYIHTQNSSKINELAQSLSEKQKLYLLLCFHHQDANMTPLFGHQHAEVSEIIQWNVVWVAHYLLSEWFVLLMQNLIHRTIIEIWVPYTVDSHQVFDDTVSHGECTFYFLIAEVEASHFHSELSLSRECLSHFWTILLDYTACIIFPIVGLKTVSDVRLTTEICVLW